MLAAEGATFTLTAALTAAVGNRYKITDTAGTGKSAYCVATGPGTSSTSLTLVPIQSDQDSAGVIGLSFASGATIVADITTPTSSLVLPIDLSEFPGEECQFVVFANGNLSHVTANGVVQSGLRLCLPCDPLTGDEYSLGRVTLLLSNHIDCYNWNGGMHLTLTGGQRYEIHLQVASDAAGASDGAARINRPRVVAIRIDPSLCHIVGDGKTAETTHTTLSNHLAFGDNAVPAGDYFAVATWQAKRDPTGADRMDVQLVDLDVGIYAEVDALANSASDYYPGGFLGKITVGASNRIRLRCEGTVGVPHYMRHGMIALIPAEMLAVAAVEGQVFASDVGVACDTTDWRDIRSANAQTLEAGDHIEAISLSARSAASDGFYEVRPEWGNPNIAAPTDKGKHGYVFTAPGAPRFSTFFLQRSRHSGGDVTNRIEGRTPTEDEVNIATRDVYFTFLKETEPIVPGPHEKIAICCEIEYGIPLKYGWVNVSGQRYEYDLSAEGIDLVVRFLETGRTYTQKATEAETHGQASTWHFDAATKLLTVTFRVGVTPSADAYYPVAVGAYLFARSHEDVMVDGEWRPYSSSLQGIPAISQSLDASEGRFTVTAEAGAIQASVGTDFVSRFFDRQWDGYRVRFWRGFPDHSTDRQDFELIADVIGGNAALDLEEGVLSLQLFDRGNQLNKPVSETSITVKEGYNPATDRDGQILAVGYGELIGVPFYRTTADETIGTGNWNTFRGFAHAIKDVLRVRLTSEIDDAGILAAQTDETATYIDAGSIRVRNDVWPDDGSLAQPGDVVYVDCIAKVVGGADSTQPALLKPGEIAKDLLQAYGLLPDADLLGGTFRKMDRPDAGRGPYRRQSQQGALVPLAVQAGLFLTETPTIADALNELCGAIGAFWLPSRQARFGLDIPDLDAHNLAPNPSFEQGSTSTAYLWSGMGGGSVSIDSTRFFVGSRSLSIANGSNAAGRGTCVFVVPTDGPYGVSLLVKSVSGDVDAFRIGWLGPDGEERLSEAFAISTAIWTRCSVAFDVPRGNVGTTTLRLYPNYGDTTATTVVVDMVEVYRLAGVIEEKNSTPSSIELEPDAFFAVGATFEVDLNHTDVAPVIVVTDAEARGLSSSEPEGKSIIQSSKRLVLGTPLIREAYSAAGIAAASAAHWGRSRHLLSVVAQGMTRLSMVGERVMHRANPRIPETPDSYPFWRIVAVDFEDEENSLDLRLIVQRQADPIVDRLMRT